MKLRFETNCHCFWGQSENLALEVWGPSDIRDKWVLRHPSEELKVRLSSNLSFIFLLLGICRTNLVTCEAIERQSPTDS